MNFESRLLWISVISIAVGVGILGFFGAWMLLVCLAAVSICAASVYRPLYVFTAIAFYLPVESLVLKYLPDGLYAYARFAPEVVIYLLCAIVIIQRLGKGKRRIETPIDAPFILFVITVAVSAIINTVAPWTALLGMRQIFRFILVFYLVIHLSPSRSFLKNLLLGLAGLAFGEAVLGLLQVAVHGPLDAMLLPSDARVYGDLVINEGVVQFWDPGSRAFATLGRYDRLGNFLYPFLLLASGFVYTAYGKLRRKELMIFLLVGVLALVFTFSRASWFAFLIGFLFLSVWVARDRRVLMAVLSGVACAFIYLGISGFNVGLITEIPGQSLVERFYETFSYTRWLGEYYGLGRTYWMIQTPLRVVAASPIFGFGPGQYGGGVAATLRNSEVYDALGLPFGVYGTEGYIDNNWFSLWGETGTLGLLFFIWMFVALFRSAYRNALANQDVVAKGVSLGVCALILGASFNALLSTLFEIRTFGFYFWMLAGIMACLNHSAEDEEERI